MAGPAQTAAGGARRRKPSAVRDAPSAAASLAPPAARTPTGGAADDPLANAEAAVGSAGASLLMYVAVCLLVAGAFVLLALTAPPAPPGGALRAVVIDAGSTGTRAQLFTFSRAPALALIDTKMHSVPAPLAALAVAAHGPEADAAADVLFRPLLDHLRAAIPSAAKRASVPVLLRATAGIRMLGSGPAELALERARAALSKSGFLFQDDWADILDERDEGVHAWTTVNYLLGKLNSTSSSDGAGNGDKKNGDDDKFVGVMDLGGASVQVVFRSDEELETPPVLTDAERLAGQTQPAAPDVVHARFLNRSYRVLTKSHLGHGLFDFTKKLYAQFDRDGVLEKGNPCFRKEKHFPRKTLRLGNLGGSEESRVVSITGNGEFDKCVASCERVLLAHDVPAASAVKAAGNTEFYAFAYFYDRTVGLGLPASPTKEELVALGNKLCGPAVTGMDTTGIAGTDEACAEFSYIYALLKRISSDFDPATGVTFKFVQYIEGHMLGWSLGTVLDQLPSVAKVQFAEPLP